jgi:Protein of unknown function with HXXEE motif
MRANRQMRLAIDRFRHAPVPTLVMTRFQMAFAGVIVAQAAHSAEEYAARLWETFPPARALSGLISQDLRQGFLVLNLLLVIFGLWCLLWPIRRGWPSAVAVAWGWVALEMVNAVGHALWALFQGGYTPGLATAPILLVLTFNLARQMPRTCP